MTTRVRAGGIASNTISTSMVQNDAVTNAKIADDSVDSDIISNSIMGKHNAIGGNDPGEYRLGKVIKDYYGSDFSTTSTSMTVLTTTSNYTGYTGGSDIELYYYSPNRRDISDWSGAYFEPQFSFDNGSSYYSLGTCGYDGGTMVQSGYIIASYQNTLWITNSTSRLPSTGTYTIKLRWRVQMYGSSGTFYVNQSHDINSGAASSYIDTSASSNRYQHFFHWIIKEWIPV